MCCHVSTEVGSGGTPGRAKPPLSLSLHSGTSPRQPESSIKPHQLNSLTHSLTHPHPPYPFNTTMSTQRIISGEKTILEKDDIVGASPAAGTQSSIAPAVPTYVLSLPDSRLARPDGRKG